MPGSKSPLTALQARKELLLLESELNRAQLCRDYAAIHQQATNLLHSGQTLITSASLMFTAFRVIRRARSDYGRRGTFPALIKLIGDGISFWLMRRG